MVGISLEAAYFDWMRKLVCGKRYSRKSSYELLLRRLHEIDFTYTMPMDGNRAEDGINLRYRFGYENSYDDRLIAKELDIRPCSILEMMIALAIRCEEDIMDNPDFGDRTGQWFWNMIVSLGLGSETDDNFNSGDVNCIIYRFLRRKYDRDGKGGLFYIEHCEKDLRTVEIWYQMCLYMDTLL